MTTTFLTETPTVGAGVPQLETTTAALGGPGGPMNAQAQELVNRYAYLIQQLALYATLASPHLTGTPTAPTATLGTNTTQIATMAAIQAAIANLVNSAPGALDTLKELADALGDDPNFATTITNALALKAPLASPALTGTPTTPTAAPGTTNTQIANMAAVAAAIAAAPSAVTSVAGRTGAVTLAVGDVTGAAPATSPALTGTPTAPTAALGTNTQQIATMAALQAAVANLLNSAPGALDTLNDLATALGDDPAFATTMTNALAGKAPLVSPALTGTPTAPTAAPGTNTTQLATMAALQTAIANLVNSAPGTLDTLSEIATALGNDPSFAITMTNALALKAPLASPALTGTPTAPTAAPGTNTTQLATMAALHAAAPSSSIDTGTLTDVNTLRAVTTTYTNTTGHPKQVLISAGAGAGGVVQFLINGSSVWSTGNNSPVTTYFTITAIVPAGATYSVSAGGAQSWWESM